MLPVLAGRRLGRAGGRLSIVTPEATMMTAGQTAPERTAGLTSAVTRLQCVTRQPIKIKIIKDELYYDVFMQR